MKISRSKDISERGNERETAGNRLSASSAKDASERAEIRENVRELIEKSCVKTGFQREISQISTLSYPLNFPK